MFSVHTNIALHSLDVPLPHPQPEASHTFVYVSGGTKIDVVYYYPFSPSGYTCWHHTALRVRTVG